MAGRTPNDRAAPELKGGDRRWGRSQDAHISDPYKATAKLHEPTLCSQCGAVFQHGRWHWAAAPADAHAAVCPACHRINDNYPAGILTLSGPFVASRKDEIVHLARNQEKAERPEHPLNRIMSVDDQAADRLVISTTDIHLPRRIGEAMTRAYKGDLSEHFDQDGYFVRINWHRPD
ncbi:MAG TPA: BCAM0308 family protein [Stellaceae bacterium]|jgi:hypothetical protein|nr:BCAM0308 family protein [Stellaceae bacterium]